MKAPTLYENTGISISVFDPLIIHPIPNYIGTMTKAISSYQQTTLAMGGYWDASIGLGVMLEDAERWFEYGLGRHIVVNDYGQAVIWEGFVNKIMLNAGGLSALRGPLFDVNNLVSVDFSTVRYNTNPPIGGQSMTTDAAGDSASQAKYGILEEVLSSGEMHESNADEVRDLYLEENKDPRTTLELNIGRAVDVSLSLECLGYAQWLDHYTYNQIAASGTQTITAKIIAVLAAEPNGFFSSDTSKIAANASTVPAFEDDNRHAWAIIKELVARGDSANNRYLFGIGQDRKAIYRAAPTTIAYNYRLTDPAQRIKTAAGNIVNPWNVVAGNWIFFTDFLAGRIQSTTLRKDPRAMFIERVQYTAPFSVAISGGKLDKLSQKLARLGLGGIG